MTPQQKVELAAQRRNGWKLVGERPDGTLVLEPRRKRRAKRLYAPAAFNVTHWRPKPLVEDVTAR